jgi:hypothetical protein
MHSSYVLAAAALALPAAAAFTAPAAAGMRPVSGAGAACAVRAPANFAAGVAPAGTRRAAVLGLRASAETKSIETIKGDLMSVLSVGTGLKQAADPSNAGSVNELLLQLEPQNPTHAPAESELLNGCWELLYTGPYAQVPSPTAAMGGSPRRPAGPQNRPRAAPFWNIRRRAGRARAARRRLHRG